MGKMVSKVLGPPVVGLVGIVALLFVSLLDMFLVVMWVSMAIIVLLLALLAWLAGYTITAMVMVSLLLTLTIISRQEVRKNESRTIHQKEKVIQIIDILIAVELSFILVFYTGLTLSTCALLLSAIIAVWQSR